MCSLGTPLGVVNLKGYILPEKKVVRAGDADSDSGEDEEEKQPEFLDMKEMLNFSSGGHMFNSSIPAKTEVEFQDLQSVNKLRVDGCFALRDPWWEITCTAQQRRKKMVLKGNPSYKLRTDLNREEGKSILSLFMTACDITAEFVNQFFQWLPSEKNIGFPNLLEVLTEFENEEINRAVAQQIKNLVINSVAGKRVQAAALYPLVMQYLPSLLPGHFTDLLGKGKGNERQPTTQMTQAPQVAEEEEDEEEDEGEEEVDLSLLAKLEEMIKTDVWKLGFSYVMSKELKLIRCEAQLRAFDECRLLWQIPDLQRNALRVYDYLKSYCYRTGSTYMDIKPLCQDLRQKVGLADEEGVWNAVHFLKEQGVLKSDRQKVAIRNLFSYEKGINDCLGALVEGEPWRIPLDVRRVLRAAAEERKRKGGAGDAVGSGGGEDSGAEPAATEKRNLTEIDRVAVAAASAHSTAKVECSARTETDFLPMAHIKQDDDQNQAAVELDADQVRAAEMICANPVTIISGKGGCGKTTVVSLVFKAAMQQQSHEREEVERACADYENDDQGSESWQDLGPGLLGPQEAQVKEEAADGSSIQAKDEVLLTAPTGRAAAMLTKKTCFTAFTLHQVMWSFMKAKKDESGQPKNWKFASVRVLVVDEGSLVCVMLLHSILTMLTKHARLRKFILLGDVRQLPSIMPGNTLHDLFHSLTLAKYAIEMRTNHRAESELIVKNSGRISDMGMRGFFRPLDFDATVDLSEPCTMPSADKSFILILLPNDPDELPNAIKRLLAEAPGLQVHETSQFIAFRRKECAMINDLCCKHYCDHLTKNHKNRVVFQPGDKVCCTKNGYVNNEDEEAQAGAERESWPSSTAMNADGGDEEQKQADKNKLRLCNGEIFFIEQDVTKEEVGRRRRKTRYLTLRDCDDRVVTASYRELQKECRLQHAWARTIHTFQGSETETVVYVLGDGKAQTWKHVYTAVTRGQKRVYVVAHKGGIQFAIKAPVIQRNTRLQGLVKELLAGQTLPSQPRSSHPQPGTPAPGFGPTQSTPRSSQKPISSRAPVISKSLSRDGEVVTVKKEDASDMSLRDDMIFTETYSWSSMNSSDDHSGELHADDITSEANCARNDGHVGTALTRGSPCTKRILSPLDSCTPRKQLKAEPMESPLGCSSLQELTLHTPKGKRLFQDPPSD
ncbi:DNA helicase B [Osmerus eperlanus]|uniref:DNA helicase B n=1 Tax=Osmerus eperlanus TaxID=29151 RepID=UPI002E12AA43